MTALAQMTNEDIIQQEVNLIKEKFTRTADIYREVCVLLFFRFNETPTANKLYRLVKKGSMTAPVEALNAFWATLRTKSKTKIERSDLPEDLQHVAGELLVTLWSKAQDQALSEASLLKNESTELINQAQQRVEKAEQEVTDVLYELAGVKDAYVEAQSTIEVMQRQLDQAGKTIADLTRQLEQSRTETAAEHQALKDREKTYRDDLERIRGDARQDSERLRESEKRALVEIDRERQTTIRIQKELDTVRTNANRDADQYRADIKVAQQQLGDARQQIGKLEGVSQTLVTERDTLQKLVMQSNEAQAVLVEKISALETNLAHEQKRSDDTQHKLLSATNSATEWENEYRTMANTCKELQGKLRDAQAKSVK